MAEGCANVNVLGPVLGVYARFYAHIARSHGIQDGRPGPVTVIQRFGSGLHLNVHLHTRVLDGVWRQGHQSIALDAMRAEVRRMTRQAPI